jgi:hypothetical protein
MTATPRFALVSRRETLIPSGTPTSANEKTASAMLILSWIVRRPS